MPNSKQQVAQATGQMAQYAFHCVQGIKKLDDRNKAIERYTLSKADKAKLDDMLKELDERRANQTQPVCRKKRKPICDDIDKTHFDDQAERDLD